MHGPAHPARLRHTAAAAALLTTLTLSLSGCTGEAEPTAAEAGQTLKTHILELLKERVADDITITDPGGKNIPCGDDRAKQTFAATGKDLPERKPDALRAMLLGTLGRIADYKITNPESTNEPIHVASESLRTNLILDAPSNGIYAISGETQCLPAHR
jgi:hypothetical protein